MIRRFTPVAVFAAVLVFLLWTAPVNHSEAEDAYYYARMARQGAWSELFHAHHLLYLPLMRAVCGVAQKADCFSALTGVSMLSGVLAVCLFAALLRRFGISRLRASGFAAALLFSYGFWRYSTTVEIYAPAAALSLLTVYCAARGAERKFFAGSILSGGAAMLMHLVTLPAVLLAAPLIYLLRRQKKQAVLYTVGVLLIAGVGYGAVIAAGIHPQTFTDTLVQRGTLLNPSTWLRALVAWGQTVLSGNFLFSIQSVAEWITQLLPSQMMQEELFMGAQAPAWIPPAASVTFGLAVGLAAGLFCVVARRAKSLWKAPPVLLIPVFGWFAAAAGMALLFEPANPEMWICVLPPFWLLAALIWEAVPQRPVFNWMPVVLAVLLLVHNWIGGMSLVKSQDGDYCRQKGAWIIRQAQPDDLILTADSHSFVTFLEYNTSARILDAKFIGPTELKQQTQKSFGRTFVFSDVIDLLPAVTHRAPESVQQIWAAADELRAGLQPVHYDSFGIIYRWKSP